MAAKLTFVSSLQRGLNAGITRADQVVPVGPLQEHQTVRADLTFGNTATSTPVKTSTTNLQLVGPGDVVGLDPRAIVRTFPRRDDNDAESEFFAMVELDQADLPWRYTPAKPAGVIETRTDRLRPWLSLIVLVEGEELAEGDVKPASLTQKLPTVSVKKKNLPAESELWAWAHLQANEELANADALDGALNGERGRVLARIMSPRLLQKQKAYRAFLVPTFERGRLALKGGASLTGVDALTPAWVRPPDTDPAAGDLPVELPYYYDWRFQTGTAGSFESLVSALVPRVLPATVGRRDMDVSDPGLGGTVPAAPAPMSVEGALQSVAAVLAGPNPTAVNATWINHFKDFVGVSVMHNVVLDDAGTKGDALVVAPPLYGRWYAAQSALVTSPPWFYSLNSDPRNRVAAALGTEVVQREQQSLMEAAWLQLDQLRSINQERKVLQTARQVFGRYLVRHVNIGFAESQFSLTSVLHGRLLVAGNNATIFGQLRASPLPRAFFSPQWRRFSSARGFLGRRLGLPIKPVGQAPNIFARINDETVKLAPTPPLPAGLNGPEATWGPAVGASLTNQEITDLGTKLGVSGQAYWGMVLFWVGRKLLIDLKGQYWWLLDKLIRLGDSLIRSANDPQRVRETLRQALRTDTLLPDQVTNAPPAPTFTLKNGVSFLDPGMLPADAGALPLPGAHDSADAAAFRTALANLETYLRRPRTQPTTTKADLPGLLTRIMNGISPGSTLLGSQTRVGFTEPGWLQTDQLEPIQAAPEIDRPMYEPLREISNEWILPGVGEIPDNTVSLVVPNQRFIEAFMTGLNHEMTRELIWNEFPVDQRGTYFRQFWDARAFVSGAGNARTPEELKDIAPIRAWPAGNGLGQNSPRPVFGAPDDPRVVLLVRGQLIKRYPNVIVYAANGPNLSAPSPAVYAERHPIFHGFLGADVAYYAFDLKLSDVKDASDPWYFVLQEQPAEPRFSLPPNAPQPPLTVPYARTSAEFAGDDTSAIVAAIGFRQPFRIAVKGSALVPPSS